MHGVPRVQGQGHGVEAVEGGPAPALLGAVLNVVVDQDPVLEELQGGRGLGPASKGAPWARALYTVRRPRSIFPPPRVVLEEVPVKGVGVVQAGEEPFLEGLPDGLGRGHHALHFRPCVATSWAFSP